MLPLVVGSLVADYISCNLHLNPLHNISSFLSLLAVHVTSNKYNTSPVDQCD
jgi:hypothetical protein